MTLRVVFEPGPGLAMLFGFHEENLRQLEASLGVRMTTRGNEVLVRGSRKAVEAAGKALERLKQAGSAGPQEPSTPDGLAVRVPRRIIVPRGERQADYVRSIRTADVVFGIGPAGTGKTYLAVACALSAFSGRQVERIILVRPVVEAGERLGFLPGDVQEKVNPYMRPLYDALQDMIDQATLRRLLEQEVVEIAPLAYMRGRTLNRAFIILDEAQNTTVEQMKMFLTRLGVGSKAVVTGDVTQIDLPREVPSGLVHSAGLLAKVAGIRQVRFLPDDVVRHALVQRILDRYEAADRKNRSRRGTG
jgi:phosphate starvation-inducible PhoH-like protein